MTATSVERAAALAALALGTTDGTGGDTAPQLERTGDEVYAGGDTPRLLVKTASTLGHRLPSGEYARCGAVPGDVVLLTVGEAKRLDALGVTVDVSADLDEVEEQLAGGFTDAQLAALPAADAVAHLAQHPEDRERVLLAEEAKPAKRQRATVIAAAQPVEADVVVDAAALAAASEQTNPLAVHGPTAEKVAESQQANDATTGE